MVCMAMGIATFDWYRLFWAWRKVLLVTVADGPINTMEADCSSTGINSNPSLSSGKEDCLEVVEETEAWEFLGVLGRGKLVGTMPGS